MSQEAIIAAFVRQDFGRRSRILATLNALLLALSMSSTAQAARRQHMVYETNINGKLYSAVVVLPESASAGHGINDTFQRMAGLVREHGERQGHVVDGYDEATTAKLILNAENWLIDFYSERGMFSGPLGARLKAEFRETESLSRGNSALVYITEHGNLDKILAMQRVVTGDVLPMEERVEATPAAGRLQRPTPEESERITLYWNGKLDKTTKTADMHLHPSTSWWRWEELAEIKNFARHGSENLLPYLFILMESHKVFLNGHGQFPIEDIVENPTIRAIFGPIANARIKEFALECVSDELRNFWESKGFKVVRQFDDPHTGKTSYWMTADRDVVLEKFVLPYIKSQGRPTSEMTLRLVEGSSIGDIKSLDKPAPCYVMRAGVGI